MATVTTTGKKKLFYKQDPDGVFRLKKRDDDDKLSTKSDKRSADDFMNELAECGYKVIYPDEPEREHTISPIIENSEEISLQSSENELPDYGLGVNYQHQSQPHLPTLHTNFSKEAGLPSPSSLSYSPVKEVSPGLNISMAPPAELHAATNLPVPASLSKITKNLLHSIDIKSPIIHVPSLALGVIVSLIATRFSQYITNGVKIFLGYALVGAAWAVVSVSVAVYAGWIKLLDVIAFKDKLLRKKVETTVPSQPTAPPAPVIPMESPEFGDVFNTGFGFDTSDSRGPRRKSREKSRATSPTKETRKNTLTTIKPFVPVERATSEPIVPRSHNKAFRTNSVEPKSNYNAFVDRSRKDRHRSNNSVDSFDSSHLKQPPLKHASTYNTSPLPSLPHDSYGDHELPFANQIKLVGSHDDSQQENHEVMSAVFHNPVKRSNSTMSKKSVLGTRAKYNRFIQSVDNLSHD